MSGFDINTYLFNPNVKGADKAITIKNMTAKEVRQVNATTMFAIVKQCSSEGDFRVARERRKGNNWNSEVEGLHIYKNRLYIDIYVQNQSTDTSYSEDIGKFFSGSSYLAYVGRLGVYVNYSDEKRVEVMRSFLLEYVYYTEIEKEERERKAKIAQLLDYTIVNRVLDYFYKQLRLDYIPTHVNSVKRDGYHHGDDAIRRYAEEHYKELLGLNSDELIDIYKRVFQKAYDDFISR